MAFSKNHGSKRGINLIMHIMVMKYGEKAGKSDLRGLIKWRFQKVTFFFAHPLSLGFLEFSGS